MFGYVIPNEKALTEEQKQVYRSYYCGLCRTIGERYGTLPRLTLNYELTFLALLLSSMEGEGGAEVVGCPIHPLKKHAYRTGAPLDYAADLTILLACAKAEDDRADERKLSSAAVLSMLKKAREKAAELHPSENGIIASCLARLRECEKANEMHPDLPASLFGELLAGVFAGGTAKEEAKQKTAALGFLLGKFLYLMDAAVDLKSDLKHGRYNPLTAYPTPLRREMLEVLMDDVKKAYEALEITDNSGLLTNILYSGIWRKYNAKYREKEAVKDDR